MNKLPKIWEFSLYALEDTADDTVFEEQEYAVWGGEGRIVMGGGG